MQVGLKMWWVVGLHSWSLGGGFVRTVAAGVGVGSCGKGLDLGQGAMLW